TVAATQPTTVDLRPLCPPIYNQGNWGSCTAQAWSRLLEFIELQDLRQKIQGPEIFTSTYTALSRLFFYYNERKINGTETADEGAQLRDGMQAASTWGVCPEDMWPYIQSDLFTSPTEQCYITAAQHKIVSAYRIEDGNLDEMKTCLAEGFPFVFGISVYSSFMSNIIAQTGNVIVPNQAENCEGGHAICAVGYDDSRDALICANSWGTDWGDKGYMFLPYDYVKNSG